MLELPILAIFATCILGMIKTSSKKRVKLPIWERENGKHEMETWLTGFLAKLKRTTTRTQKCRLILSVERMQFEENWYASAWDSNSLQKMKVTEFQKMILKSDNTLENQLFCRSVIKAENGQWNIPTDLKTKMLSEGGEALVFAQNFGNKEIAVRIQIFDAFLFTEDFPSDLLFWKIHFRKGNFFDNFDIS